MKRYIIILMTLSLTTMTAMAQNTFRISYQIGVPMGATADFIDQSAYRGFSFEYYNEVIPKLHLGLEAQWNFWNKTYDRETYEFGFGAINAKQWRYKHVVPVTVNLMYDLASLGKVNFYGKFGTGAYWVNDEVWAGLLTIAENKTLYGMTPGLGFTVNPGGLVGFNFATEYQFIVNGQAQFDGRTHSHYWNFKFGLNFTRD